MKNYSWLQISDLHIYESTDWNIMLKHYEEFAKVVKPDFIIITGDYKHIIKNNSYINALKFLNAIVSIFGIDKENIFMIPGNHDVKDYELRKEIINTIIMNTEDNPDAYKSYMNNDKLDLRNAFDDYCDFVKDFYKDSISDDRINKPSDVLCIPWNNTVNIIMLNTALISIGNQNETEIFDINKLSELKMDTKLPAIVIAHHDISSLAESQKTRMNNLLNTINAKVYLCGDEHKLSKKSIEKINDPNYLIPRIVCGKSAIEIKDDYSDICVIEYTCKSQNTSVQVYKYNITSGFIQSNDFYYNVNKKFSFNMNEKQNTHIGKKEKYKEKIIKQKSQNDIPISIWLPDAEQADGKQTRFDSFTNTDKISEFLNDNSHLGIVSVKGIGKTFVLQVKRVKSSKKFYCLPKCTKPSIKNNWATERISFNSYSSLKTSNPYNDLVLLWKIAIKCYVINNLVDEVIKKTLNEYFEKNKISNEFVGFCTFDENKTLEAIINNIIDLNNWSKEVNNNYNVINNICRIVINKRKQNNSSSKDIAIFIDKVDQAIKETNAEPPADCVLCKNKNFVNECKSEKKFTEFCISENGCKSKTCCFGCEVFASSNSNNALRIYEDSNASKIKHINIWQYLQLALMQAAVDIYDEMNGGINVFFTIREEAFNCEDSRLGEHNQKTAARIIKLNYDYNEQHNIFIDCIKEQDPYYLFKPEIQNKDGNEEYAFVGVNELCHPYCLNPDGSNQKESLFHSIYRHSFDRTRDIQRYGEVITNHMNEIKECDNEHQREEKVKEIIEETASELAYCSRKSENTVNPSYYTEKLHYLPNYWADNDNFEELLSLIDRNLLFKEDVIRVCKIINKRDDCPKGGCKTKECKRHPFSMLYNMGYLGHITPNPNHSGAETQNFLNSNQISYFIEEDDLQTEKRTLYIMHPALSKSIQRKYCKTFLHFSGFILGKGIKVDKELLLNILNDRKKMNLDEFENKYYYRAE